MRNKPDLRFLPPQPDARNPSAMAASPPIATACRLLIAFFPCPPSDARLLASLSLSRSVLPFSYLRLLAFHHSVVYVHTHTHHFFVWAATRCCCCCCFSPRSFLTLAGGRVHERVAKTG